MKKVLSLLLSLVMLFSITTGIDMSAYASYDNIYEAYNYTFGEVYYGNITYQNLRDYLKFEVDASMSGITIEFKADVCDESTGGKHAAVAISDLNGNNIYLSQVDYNSNLGICYLKKR